LSGGESQRIKLVSELSRGQVGHTLYVLDEPTTGLHKADVSRLMNTLRELANRGNSILLIEHDPDVLRQSDYLLELGPGPGEAGGKIIFAERLQCMSPESFPQAPAF
jgi:excinuclease ABC subunit A